MYDELQSSFHVDWHDGQWLTETDYVLNIFAFKT